MKENLKTTIGTIVVFILIILGLYLLYNSDMVKNYLNKTTDNALEPTSMEIVKNSEFEPFSKFLKNDLSEDDKISLGIVLKERIDKINQAKQILDEEFNKKESDMAAAFENVSGIREEIKNEIMPFINPEKIQDFEEFYQELGSNLESEYVLK